MLLLWFAGLSACDQPTSSVPAGDSIAANLFRTCVVVYAEAEAHLREDAEALVARAIDQCSLPESNYLDAVRLEVRQDYPDWEASSVIPEADRRLQVIRPTLEQDISRRLNQHRETWDPDN